MKLLIIGGMHGNEPLGIELVKQLRRRPVASVDFLIANPRATVAHTRFIKQDLNRSFPGDILSKDYESRRAAEILSRCQPYDLVLDFHNSKCPANDCGFIGEVVSPLLSKVASVFDLNRLVIADYDCLNKFAPNCLSVEVSLDSQANSWTLWYERIRLLSRLTSLDAKLATEIYRFVYRMTLEDRDRLQLADKKLQAFKPIEPRLADKMNVKSPAYPIFVGDSFTPDNYGGLLNKT